MLLKLFISACSEINRSHPSSSDFTNHFVRPKSKVRQRRLRLLKLYRSEVDKRGLFNEVTSLVRPIQDVLNFRAPQSVCHAPTLQKSSSLIRGQFEGRVKQLMDNPPAVRLHVGECH